MSDTADELTCRDKADLNATTQDKGLHQTCCKFGDIVIQQRVYAVRAPANEWEDRQRLNVQTCLGPIHGYSETGPQPVPQWQGYTGRREICVLAWQLLQLHDAMQHTYEYSGNVNRRSKHT